MQHRMMYVYVYKSKVPPVNGSPAYYFLRVVNPITNSFTDSNITEGKATELVMMGVPTLQDGGGI